MSKYCFFPLTFFFLVWHVSIEKSTIETRQKHTRRKQKRESLLTAK